MRWLDDITNSTDVSLNKLQGRTGKPGVLQSTGLQRVGHDLVTKQQQWQSTEGEKYTSISFKLLLWGCLIFEAKTKLKWHVNILWSFISLKRMPFILCLEECLSSVQVQVFWIIYVYGLQILTLCFQNGFYHHLYQDWSDLAAAAAGTETALARLVELHFAHPHGTQHHCPLSLSQKSLFPDILRCHTLLCFLWPFWAVFLSLLCKPLFWCLFHHCSLVRPFKRNVPKMKLDSQPSKFVPTSVFLILLNR